MATPAQTAASKAPPKKEALIQSYNRTLKEDVKSMRVNFEEIIRLSHVHEKDQEYQGELKNNEIQIRGANILRAAESLMKLISDLKDHLIINDFYSINYERNNFELQVKDTVKEIDRKICRVWSDMIRSLEDIEEEYYMSPYPDPTGLRMSQK